MQAESWQVTLFTIVMQYVIVVLVITVHEWAHAWMADRCGDPTARYFGRLTLNPLPHLDFVGTVVLPLLMIAGVFGGVGILGWGKPVPVNPSNFRRYRRDDVLVSMAGPMSNVIMSIVALVLIRVTGYVPPVYGEAARELFLKPLAGVSFGLAFFNVLPVPPLDGSHVMRQLLSWEWREIYDRMGRYGFLILLVFINTPLCDWYFGAVAWLYRGCAGAIGGFGG